MGLSKEAEEEKPKRPQNAYFKFRIERLKELEGEEDRGKKVKEEWENIDEDEKARLESEYKDAMDEWKIQMKDWKEKYGIEDDDKRKKSKKKVESSPEPEKTKGEKKKKRESNEKDKKKKEGTKSNEKDKRDGKSKNKNKKKWSSTFYDEIPLWLFIFQIPLNKKKKKISLLIKVGCIANFVVRLIFNLIN